MTSPTYNANPRRSYSPLVRRAACSLPDTWTLNSGRCVAPTATTVDFRWRHRNYARIDRQRSVHSPTISLAVAVDLRKEEKLKIRWEHGEQYMRWHKTHINSHNNVRAECVLLSWNTAICHFQRKSFACIDQFYVLAMQYVVRAHNLLLWNIYLFIVMYCSVASSRLPFPRIASKMAKKIIIPFVFVVFCWYFFCPFKTIDARAEFERVRHLQLHCGPPVVLIHTGHSKDWINGFRTVAQYFPGAARSAVATARWALSMPSKIQPATSTVVEQKKLSVMAA